MIAGILAGITVLLLQRGHGYFLISSSPTSAQILIGGEKYGNTPFKVKLKPEVYIIEALKKGYITSEKIVKVESKKPKI